ncbi:hypothetical protein [Cupriavidus necator]|uniref:hypothetical protein n=1 Tax=Cupriavidus necator TaxID=106590 RepID=UPI0012D2F8F6|nr:hypothetical protein [Cupriavidus necator]
MFIACALGASWLRGTALPLRKAIAIFVVICGIGILGAAATVLGEWTADGILGDALFVLAGSMSALASLIMQRRNIPNMLALAVIYPTALIAFGPLHLFLDPMNEGGSVTHAKRS